MRAFLAALITTLFVVALATPARAADCAPLSAGFGVCANDPGGGSDAGFDATETVPGGSGSGEPSGTAPGAGGGSGAAPAPIDPQQITDTLGSCLAGDQCNDGARTGTPAVTLRDLASFRPAAPRIRMEPDGWMLTGLPANAIADAPAATPTGTLLGRPIAVRFTAAEYTWNWGDGTSTTTDQPGRTWENLGVPRFSETATSHTYTERGTVTVSLTVAYTVEYRIGAAPDGGGQAGAWTAVAGTVTSAAAMDAYVGTADTVLVPGDCTADPDATGC